MARGLFEAAGAGRTVLAPTAELAASLFDRVERMHTSAGHAVWPTPLIRDVGSWLRERYQARQRADATLPRLLNELEERELWRSVILDGEAGRLFLEPAGAARSARRAWRGMSEYGIPAAALGAAGTAESLALLRWGQEFERRCRDLRCIASDRLWHDAATVGPQVVWIESEVWRPAARRWLEASGAAMLPAAAPHESQFRATAPLRRVQAVSPDAEVSAIAEWARLQRAAQPDARAWICIPDLDARRSQIVDAFDAVLAPQRFSLTPREAPAVYAVAGGIPLNRYAPVRAALQLLTVAAGEVPFDDFSALLRLPELQATPAEASAAASLDMALRDRGPHAADIDGWLALCAAQLRGPGALPVAAWQRLTAALRILSAVRGEQSLSRWVTAWVAAFEAGPWVHRARWSSTEYQAAERFRELLAALATAEQLLGARSAASAARLLQRAARETPFAPQTGIPPIWVSAQVIDPWLEYDGIWISGCSEERWPAPLDPLPLLPIPVQRDHGVVAASSELQLQRALFLQRRWPSRAGECVFSCADCGDGRHALPSPLLPEAPTTQAAAATQPHWRALTARAPQLEWLVDETAPPFAAPERTRGVATLRAQSRCAFRGFAETRLHVEVLRRPVPGFSLRERGEMLHHALHDLWSELRSSHALHTMALAALDERVRNASARAIARQVERRDPGLRWQRREAPRLAVLLHKWLATELLREPFEVDGLEQGAQSVFLGGLELTVRIDRVDRLADGARLIIDYKTGAATADWRGERPDNPQLPLYALVHPERLVAVAYGRVNAGECCFVAETERGGLFNARSRQPSSLEGLPTLAALVGLWRQRLEKIAAQFAAGHAEVAPTPRACASCGLQPLCRITAALEAGETS